MPDVPEAGRQLLALYDQALPEVYGYLLDRCGDVTTAEDLTSETFLAAVRSADAALISIPWMIGVARHKLVDHWRRHARDDRLVAPDSSTTTRAAASGPSPSPRSTSTSCASSSPTPGGSRRVVAAFEAQEFP